MIEVPSRFGPVLTPAKQKAKTRKHTRSFQLTIQNRLGAALKFASVCDNNAELGAAAVNPNKQANTEIPCPLCCDNTLPSDIFSNVLPSSTDESAAAHYMFCSRPSDKQILHWHSQECYLCQSLIVKGNIHNEILLANETYRKLERHRCQRALSLEEHDELVEVVDLWRKFSSIENIREKNEALFFEPMSMPQCDVNEALSSLNLAHAYFNGLGVIERNIDLCVKHMRRAAKFGLPAAKFNLGLLYLWGYLKGKGGDVEAVYYFRKAANDGYLPARYRLALMVRDGISAALKDDRKYNTDIYEDEVITHHTSSSSQDSLNSNIQNNTKKLYGSKNRKHSKTEVNLRHSLHLLLNLVAQGFRDACLDAACLLARGTQCNYTPQHRSLGLRSSANMWHRAFVIWCKGAKLCCPVCTHHIATCYKTGLGVSRSVPLAMQCYSKAAAMDHVASVAELKMLQKDLPNTNHHEHFYANKWAAIQNVVEKKRQIEDRSQSHQSVGGEGVVNQGVVGITSQSHHHHHHHQREWQPWFKQPDQQSNPFQPHQVNHNKSDSSNLCNDEPIDVKGLLKIRNNSLLRNSLAQRSDHFKYKHTNVIEEDKEKEVFIEDKDIVMAKTLYDGVDRTSGTDWRFETKYKAPKGSYQENFQRAFDIIDH